MLELAAAAGVTYTRYSDDITFSAPHEFDLLARAEEVLTNHGFLVNDAKTRSVRYGQALYVTGLSTSEPDYPRLPKRHKRQCHVA